MAPRKIKSRIRSNSERVSAEPSNFNGAWAMITLLGPPILMYLYLRCVNNLCILWYFPLTIPGRLEDYFNLNAFAIVLGFIIFQMIWKRVFSQSNAMDGMPDEDEIVPTSFSSFICLSSVMTFFHFMKPEILISIQDELIPILVTTVIFVLVYSTVISLTSLFSFKAEANRGFFSLFLNGPNIAWPDFLSEWFFFTHIGYVGWGMLNLLFFLNALGNGSITESAMFIFGTQLLFISHSLLFEKLFQRRAFIRMEKVSYKWLVKFVIFMPFIGSLPMLQVTVTDFFFYPNSIHLCNLVFFLFGFLIYTTSGHQMDRFLKDPVAAKDMDYVNVGTDRGVKR